jgi:hypothetical protein
MVITMWACAQWAEEAQCVSVGEMVDAGFGARVGGGLDFAAVAADWCGLGASGRET